MTLADLGPRICIMGPSNSGKSTLANAIGRSRCFPVIQLDRLRHEPNTDWQPRPVEEFLALHDKAIKGAHWIIDGNYSISLPQRLARATGVIMIDVPTVISLVRYLRRSWFERARHGVIKGGRDSVKWLMIRHILVVTPQSHKRYAALYDEIGLPKFRLGTTSDLAQFYRSEGLKHY